MPVCSEYIRGRHLTEEELDKAIKLGWCVEIVCGESFDWIHHSLMVVHFLVRSKVYDGINCCLIVCLAAADIQLNVV